MTEPPRLPTTKEEWEILAHRWPRLPEHERERLEASMNRAQRKAFERTVAKLNDGQNHFASKVTTRQDVVTIVGLFWERNALPMAARLDAVERWITYRELPWWRRARLTLLAWGEGALLWLEKHGIRFYTLNTEGENGQGESRDEGHAPGVDTGAAGQPAGEAPGGPSDDRLQELRPGGDVGRGDEGGARGRIEVVNR